jgi:hypothetical protein
LAVNAGATAIPLVPVITLAPADPPANVPLAPLVGAAKITVTPLTGFPLPSVMVACSAVANAVLTVALCGVPPLAATTDPFSAAAFKVTFPVPDVIAQVTVSVCPALAAW